MFDRNIVKEILNQVYEATQKINKRFAPVHSADDFIGSEAGMEKLDSICMLLIAIGESIKNLDRKTKNELLSKYPNTEWKKIMGLRDIISQRYFDVDAEIVSIHKRLFFTIYSSICDISCATYLRTSPPNALISLNL